MLKTIKQKNKDMLMEKEITSSHIMQDKIKPVLRERGLEILRQKSSRSACFNCHPKKKKSADLSQDNKRKYGGYNKRFLKQNARHE
jgi:hypothetical protein